MKDLIGLVYGLGFFSLGLVALASRGISSKDDPMVKGRPYIAAFGFFHSLAEWIELSSLPSLDWLPFAAMLIHGLSFVFLTFYALEGPARRQGRFLGELVFILVYLAWVLFSSVQFAHGSSMHDSKVVSRLVINFPASLLCALAVRRYAQSLSASAPRRITRGIHLLGYSFLVYMVLSGVPLEVTPMYSKLAPWMAIGRSLCAIAIALLYNSINHYLEWDARLRQRRAERRADAAEEQRKLADELHDMVIQDIFGLGLEIERRLLSHPETENALFLQTINARLNETIRKIRGFLSGVSSASNLGPEGLEEAIVGALSQFSGKPGIHTKYRLDMEVRSIVSRKPELGFHIARICEESVRNICRHANPKRVRVELSGHATGIQLTVSADYKQIGDVAVGATLAEVEESLPSNPSFTSSQGGYGMTSIRHRVALLRGTVEWRCDDTGCLLNVMIPGDHDAERS